MAVRNTAPRNTVFGNTAPAKAALTNILVHLDNTRASLARAEYALRLAQKCDAHLTALYCIAPFRMPGHAEAMIPPGVLKMQEQAAAQGAASARVEFEAAATRAGRAARSEWRAASGDPLDVLALHARYADLVVVGQCDPDRPEAHGADFPGALALAAGRPVLVVPYVGKYTRIGEKVLVAWNAGREAARAVNDAMPILAEAHSVAVLSVNPSRVNGHGERPGADIALHLARHGIKVETAESQSDEIGVADVLLSRAADMDADLMVMGAFGHARLRELVLGGVTREVLKHMTLPVLMSH